MTHKQKTHELKCWPEFFQAIKSGRKTCEVRKNDRDFQVGDRIDLREFKPETCVYSGRFLKLQVTHIETWGQVDGNVVMSLKRVREDTR